MSDFLKGVIWRVGIDHASISISIKSTYTRASGFQVNGLKVHGRHMYFTNTAKEILVKVAVNMQGEFVSEYAVLPKVGFGPDDFALDVRGNAYVTCFLKGSNGIVFVPAEGGKVVRLADVKGPTSCAFGCTAEDFHALYVSATGGM